MKLKVQLLSIVLLASCVQDSDFDVPDDACTTAIVPNISYAELKNLYAGSTLQIQQDLILEGYVSSSDDDGNFFSVLHFQDKPINPTAGLQIDIDVRDTHLFYPVGTRIFIKLKDLYLGKSKGVFKVGGVFTSFGNLSVGRLPAAVVDSHIFVSCDDSSTIISKAVEIETLDRSMVHTLVTFEHMEVEENALGKMYAEPEVETVRTLLDCVDNELVLLNSGFSDFQSKILPEGNGSITGVLLLENDTYQLVIRNLEDINFTEERCEEVIDQFTSDEIFISELADPDNNPKARFVELYNAGIVDIALNGWTLRRYTNANTDVSSSIDLSALTIQAGGTLVISPDIAEFEVVYGFTPDLGVGTNSPADSNGDDNLELVDPFGVVIDVFGRIGQDGSGTDHEFEDGRALRKADISKGNATYTFTEWVLCNDTGAAGTANRPKNAPEDFSPGNRN